MEATRPKHKEFKSTFNGWDKPKFHIMAGIHHNSHFKAGKHLHFYVLLFVY